MSTGSLLLAKLSNVQYIVLARLLLIKTKDLLFEGSVSSKHGIFSMSWWLARVLLLQQRILDERSSSLFDLLQVFTHETLHHFGTVEKVTNYWGAQLLDEEPSSIVSAIHLETGLMEYTYGRVDSCKERENRMASTSGFAPKATADLTSSRFQKTVCLYDWWLTKAAEEFEGKRLAIGGVTSSEYPNKSKWSCTRQVQRVFTSSPIIKRHDAFSVETADGICVVIKGFINKDRTMGNGFSLEIFNHFVFGFPPQWKECALKYMGQEPVSEVASPRQAGLENVVPSSLNKETPTGLSKVTREERRDTQISEECSQAVPEEQNHDEFINQDANHRRTKSNRLSRSPTKPETSSNTKEGSSNSQIKKIAESNHFKVIGEENHGTQNLKKCSELLPGSVSEEGFAGDGSVSEEGFARDGSQPTCDIEEEQNCGDVMNRDGEHEPSVANITPGLKRKRNAKQDTSSRKFKRRTRSNCSKVITEEEHDTQNLEESSEHVPEEFTSEGQNSERNSDILSQPPIDSKRKRKTKQSTSRSQSKRKSQSNRSKVIGEEEEGHNSQILKDCSEHEQKAAIDEGIAKEGSQPTSDIERGQNCGDERNSSTLLQPPVDSKQKRKTKQSTSRSQSKRKSQSNRSEVIGEETQILKDCSEHAPETASDEGISKEDSQPTGDVEQGQNCGDERNSNTLLQPPIEHCIANSTPGLKRKGNAKQGTPNSKIKRKINFDASGKSVAKEAKKHVSKVSPEAQSFKRSRSGRLLIPHMEYWRNQVPVYDRERNITGILEDSTVTPLRGSKSEPPRRRRR